MTRPCSRLVGCICCRGRLRIYHGVNFVRKEPPWYHPALLEPQYARDLSAWGLRVVRLGTMWSGVEPREGYYDMEYLNNIKTIVNNFKEHGVSVILDMHQDVASHHFKTYDGIPAWLVDKLRSILPLTVTIELIRHV